MVFVYLKIEKRGRARLQVNYSLSLYIYIYILYIYLLYVNYYIIILLNFKVRLEFAIFKSLQYMWRDLTWRVLFNIVRVHTSSAFDINTPIHCRRYTHEISALVKTIGNNIYPAIEIYRSLCVCAYFFFSIILYRWTAFPYRAIPNTAGLGVYGRCALRYVPNSYIILCDDI